MQADDNGQGPVVYTVNMTEVLLTSILLVVICVAVVVFFSVRMGFYWPSLLMLFFLSFPAWIIIRTSTQYRILLYPDRFEIYNMRGRLRKSIALAELTSWSQERRNTRLETLHLLTLHTHAASYRINISYFRKQQELFDALTQHKPRNTVYEADKKDNMYFGLFIFMALFLLVAAIIAYLIS